jgi:hypothetical protein
VITGPSAPGSEFDHESRVSSEQIRQDSLYIESGTDVGEICRKLGVTEATPHLRLKQFAGLDDGELQERRALQTRIWSCDRSWRTSSSTMTVRRVAVRKEH